MLAIRAVPRAGLPPSHLLLLLFRGLRMGSSPWGHLAVETQPQWLLEVSLRTGKLEIQP